MPDDPQWAHSHYNIEAEQKIISVKNTSGSEIAAGAFVCYDVATDDNFTSVILPDSTNIELPAGILMDTLADDEVGRCLVRGPYDTAFVLGHASLTKGDSLKLVASQRYCTYDGAPAAAKAPGAIVAREDWTTTSEAAKKVYIRL